MKDYIKASRAGCAVRRNLLRWGRRRTDSKTSGLLRSPKAFQRRNSQAKAAGYCRNLSWSVGARLPQEDESDTETCAKASSRAPLYKEPIATSLHRSPAAGEPRDGQCWPMCLSARDGRRPVHTFQGSRPAALSAALSEDLMSEGEKIYHEGVPQRGGSGLQKVVPRPGRPRHGPVSAPGRPARRLRMIAKLANWSRSVGKTRIIARTISLRSWARSPKS